MQIYQAIATTVRMKAHTHASIEGLSVKRASILRVSPWRERGRERGRGREIERERINICWSYPSCEKDVAQLKTQAF